MKKEDKRDRKGAGEERERGEDRNKLLNVNIPLFIYFTNPF